MPVVIPVRTHFASQDLWFDPASSGARGGDHVVVTTERGTEFGLATDDPFDVDDEELKSPLKPVLRIATENDIRQAEGLARKGEEAMPLFRKLVKEQGLDMKPVGVEFLFGGERAVFYFASEERIDFRELVRVLATHFHKRVDMRQIGVRDEVRLRGGFGPCGQELCCSRFGGKFEPVSIRMAKEQDLPLNSAKISGMCGRLMCCLRYEFEAYKDFKTRAPKRNAVVETPLGLAKVVDFNTPRELVTMRLENGKSFTVPLSGMQCSEACRKRAEQTHIPLRPDTVTREALEELGTAEIMAQLAEMDRQANPDAYELDSSLLTGRDARRVERQRRQRASQREEGAPEGGAREGGRTRRPSRGDGTDERPAQRKGMRPRRTSGAGEGEAQPQQREGAQRRQRRGAQEAPTGEGQARRTRRPSATASEAQAGGTRAQGAQRRQGAQGRPEGQPAEPQRRTRRHHTATEGVSAPASARPQGQEGRPRHQDPERASAQEAGGRDVQQQARPRRQHKGAPEGTARQGGQGAQQRQGHGGQQQGQTRQRPQQNGGVQRSQQQGASGAQTQQPGAPARRRRRRPGDKGGDAAGRAGSQE